MSVHEFRFKDQPMRVIGNGNAARFVHNDACAILELNNAAMALRRISERHKGVSVIDTLGGTQQINVVDLSGLLELVMRSDKPIAAQFREWVCDEVLPQIFETGSYTLTERGADNVRSIASLTVVQPDLLAPALDHEPKNKAPPGIDEQPASADWLRVLLERFERFAERQDRFEESQETLLGYFVEEEQRRKDREALAADERDNLRRTLQWFSEMMASFGDDRDRDDHGDGLMHASSEFYGLREDLKKLYFMLEAIFKIVTHSVSKDDLRGVLPLIEQMFNKHLGVAHRRNGNWKRPPPATDFSGQNQLF